MSWTTDACGQSKLKTMYNAKQVSQNMLGFFVRAKTNGRWSFGPPMSTWIMVYGKSAIIDMKKRGILSTDKGNCYSIWQTRMAIKTGRHRETWLVKLIFVLRVAVSGVKQITYTIHGFDPLWTSNGPSLSIAKISADVTTTKIRGEGLVAVRPLIEISCFLFKQNWTMKPKNDLFSFQSFWVQISFQQVYN